jgi:hypothetical protein
VAAHFAWRRSCLWRPPLSLAFGVTIPAAMLQRADRVIE